MSDLKTELPQCIAKMVDHNMESPRRCFSENPVPQGFTVLKMDEEAQKVVIRFDSGNRLDLHFWRFNLVHGILKNANGEYVAIGSRFDPEKAETIESRLYEEAKKMGYHSARTKTAPHICDFFVLCKFAQYGKIKNPKTGKTIQAIRMLIS